MTEGSLGSPHLFSCFREVSFTVLEVILGAMIADL